MPANIGINLQRNGISIQETGNIHYSVKLNGTKMKAFLVDDEQKDEWNGLSLKEPSFSLMQSWKWGEFKEKMGWSVYRIAVEEQKRVIAGAQMLVKTLPLGFTSIAYVPRGPLCDWMDQDTTSCLLSEMHRIARYKNAAFLTLEPPIITGTTADQLPRQYGFRSGRYTNQPRSTIIVDISPDENEILLRMRKKTRQYIHSAIREGISIRAGTLSDLGAYYDLIRETARREHFPARTREYYEREWQIFSRDGQCILLMAYHGHQLLAVRTVYCHGDHAAEFHAGSVEHTPVLHPNYLLVWKAMQWAKSQGCKTYDLWGIPDEVGRALTVDGEPPVVERSDGLWGVYRFKSGFSKNIVSYVGSYDYVYHPFLYALLANRLISGGVLDRIMSLMDIFKHK